MHKLLLSLLLVSLIGCSQDEPNFSVACNLGNGEYNTQNKYVEFNFKENIVIEKTIPTKFGLVIFPDSKETLREYPIIELTSAYIKFGPPYKSETLTKVENVFDRTNLTLTSTASRFRLDGSLSEPLSPEMPNPAILQRDCKKPQI